MNTIVILFSIAALWSLMTFNGKGKRLKLFYGFIAYLLVVFFGVQCISLFVLKNDVYALQVVITILIAFPVIRHDGNVSQAINEIKMIWKRITQEDF